MDIQDLRPERPVYLERVGFKGIKRRATLKTPLGEMMLDLELDVYVDLDKGRRGVHLSRNIEAVESALVKKKASSLESLLRAIAGELLARHDYAAKATVQARTVYYVDVEFAGSRTSEPVEASVEVSITRERVEGWRVSATVKGMTVCPSAMATIADMLGGEEGSVPSHSQKVVLTGSLETRGVMVRIEDLARALMESMSAPTITLLKKRAEARLILSAFRKPMFVEDVVREAAWRLSNIPSVPGDAIVEVEARSLESIHPHDLIAYLRARASEVKEDRRA